MSNQVLSTLTGITVKSPDQVINQGWHGSQPFMTGCLINTVNVFSVCAGLVIDIGVDDKNNLYSVTVEYNSALWVRYCLLKSCNVAVGDRISVGQKVGITHSRLLRFEYCNKDISDFPVRVSNNQLYKHDPTPILFGQELLLEVS